MANVRISHLLIIVVLQSCFKNLVFTNAFNGDFDVEQILDYFVETARNLRLIDSIENFKTSNGNETNVFKKNYNNIDSSFSNEKQRYEQPENKFVFMDVLKTVRENRDTYKTPVGINRGISINGKIKNDAAENLEDIGRELIMDEGRKVKTKKLMMRLLLGLKVLTVGVILPLVLGVALFASWKGITISLMALLLAGIVSLKIILSGKQDPPQHVLVAAVPAHHQPWWRKTEPSGVLSWENPHDIAYSGHQK